VLLSKVNLAVAGIAGTDKKDPVLNRVHLEADGTSVASNGRAVMAVAPVVPERAAAFPRVEDEEAEPGPTGVGVSLSTVADASKAIPKADKHPSLGYVQVTRCDAREVELMATDGVRKRKVSGMPMRGGFLPWRQMLRTAREGKAAVRVCVDRLSLIRLLKAFPPDPGNRNPVFLEMRGDGRPIVARAVSVGTGQRVMGMVNPLDAAGQWLNEDGWETDLREVGEDEPPARRRRVARRRGRKIIVAGSRGVTDFEIVRRAIEGSGFDVSEVVSGKARGADALGERWARENGIPVKEFPADWERRGKSAGFLRNAEMARYADGLVAVWDGASHGTKHMIETMQSMGKPVWVHPFPERSVRRARG
jgi:hypothetical protein